MVKFSVTNDETKSLEPRARGEKIFKALHAIRKMNDPAYYNDPENEKAVFSGSKQKQRLPQDGANGEKTIINKIKEDINENYGIEKPTSDSDILIGLKGAREMAKMNVDIAEKKHKMDAITRKNNVDRNNPRSTFYYNKEDGEKDVEKQKQIHNLISKMHDHVKNGNFKEALKSYADSDHKNALHEYGHIDHSVINHLIKRTVGSKHNIQD